MKSMNFQKLEIVKSPNATFSINDSEHTLKDNVDSRRNYGMLMALSFCSDDNRYLFSAGYENGHAVLFDIRKASNAIKDYSLFSNPILCLRGDFNPENQQSILLSGAIGNTFYAIPIDSGFGSSEQLIAADKKETNVVDENSSKRFRDPIKMELPHHSLIKQQENGEKTNKQKVNDDLTDAMDVDESIGINSIDIRSSDHRIFATGNWNGTIDVFDLKKKKSLGTLRNHWEAVNCIRFERNSTRMASASKDLKIAIWNINPQKKSSPSKEKYLDI